MGDKGRRGWVARPAGDGKAFDNFLSVPINDKKSAQVAFLNGRYSTFKVQREKSV